MGTIDRYILREVGLSWLAVTGVLVAIFFSYQLAQVLGQAAERGYPRGVILGLIGLMSVQNGTNVIPIALLIGVVLALGRLYHESEMAALRACGVGPGRLLRPVSVVALAVTALLAWLALDAAPRSFGRVQEIQREVIKAAEFGVLDPGRFHTFARGSAVFYAESVDADGTFRRVFLQRRIVDRVEIMLAERARHLVQEGGTLHVLVLYDGERYEGTPGQAEMRRVRFAEHGIPVRIGLPDSGPARVESRGTLDLLADPAPRAQAEFQRRVSLPLMALILTLLAVPLAELRPRQGRYARIGIVILVYFVYANLLTAAQTWIEKGWIVPAVGVWWTHALVLLVALWLWWRHSPPAWATR
ncbi:MAG TPA: LPS export ABC transporter permease LptF [Steroidobacteraceae bacterium]|nr:LPS export ABC transporter permease LptF [Steroidobacteraceae bacterium]